MFGDNVDDVGMLVVFGDDGDCVIVFGNGDFFCFGLYFGFDGVVFFV